MKKFRLFVLSFILIVVPFNFVLLSSYLFRAAINKPFCYGLYSSQTKYAKVKENCLLHKTSNISDDSYSNVYFIIPNSYFVVVLNDDDPNYAYVSYKHILGYVSKDYINEVDFVPNVPTLESITFDIGGVSTQLRRTPDATSDDNVLIVVPSGTHNITYIGEIYGTRPNNIMSNLWYYAVYSPDSDPTSIYEGYIIADKTTNLTPIKLSEEPKVEPPDVVSDDEEIATYTMSPAVKTILICLICLPVVLVFILLLISNHKGKNREIEKQLAEETPKSPKPDKKKDIKQSRRISRLDDLEGQTLERKPVYYTNFLNKTTSASLKPEFPKYEVVDDDDLL